MKQYISRAAIAAGALFMTVGAVSTDATAYGGSSSCPTENIDGWFPHSQTPEPDNANFDSSTICNFHEWSWQMFLWLTQDWNGKPRFLSFASPYELIGIQTRDVLMPRMMKNNKAESFDEFLQAGTDGIFVDLNGNPVYYSQYLDDTFVGFMEKNDLTNPEAVRAFDANTPFPIGSLELKASWRIVEDGEDMSKFFTMDGSVYGLANKGGKIVIDQTNIRQVKLALVGFHIGGIVKGHPEMIWATFEQVDNAPNVPADFTPNTVISDEDFTFYHAGTPFSGCNVNYAQSPLLKLDEATQKLSPITEACRMYEFGNSAKNDPRVQKSVETNDLNVSDMNKAVMPRLAAEGDVWANYREVGAIWFRPTDALKPGMNLSTDFAPDGSQLLIGSLKLSNATIETFTQVQSTMNNCFRCHNTEQVLPPSAKYKPLKAMNLNISHAFQNIYFWSQEQAADDTQD